MKLKIKRLNHNAEMPYFATEGAAGMDLTAVTKRIEVIPDSDQEGMLAQKYTYGTGLAIEIPKGYVGLLFPRSSIHKTGMDLTNCVGVIDSDYRGEISLVFRTRSITERQYQVGDRVGQLVLIKLPSIEIVEVNELSETVRGTGGFGSTGV